MKYSHLDFWSTIFFYSIQICYFLQMSYNQYIWDTCVTHIFALKNVLYVHWTFDKIFDDQKSNYPSKDECDELQYKDWAAFLFMFRKFQQFRNMTYVTDELHPKPITLYQILYLWFSISVSRIRCNLWMMTSRFYSRRAIELLRIGCKRCK